MPRAGRRRSVSNPSQPAGGQWSEQDLIASVEAGPKGPDIGAFFDFDGTLIDGYSLTAFARHHLRSMDVTPADLGRMLLSGIRGVTSEKDFEEFTELGFRAWAGRTSGPGTPSCSLPPPPASRWNPRPGRWAYRTSLSHRWRS